MQGVVTVPTHRILSDIRHSTRDTQFSDLPHPPDTQHAVFQLIVSSPTLDTQSSDPPHPPRHPALLLQIL